MAESDEAKDNNPELPSDYKAYRRSYRWPLVYGPWAIAVLGVGLIGAGLFMDLASAVAAVAIGFGAGMVITGVVLPRMRGSMEVGPGGMKGTLERLPNAMVLVRASAKEAAEQAIPADEPEKERRVNEVVGHTVSQFVKDTLAEDFELRAEWRDQQAAEHPDDARHTRAAEGLRGLAEYVLNLPDDDHRLRHLAEVWSSPDPYDGAAQVLLDRYGFGPGSHLGPPDHDSFFTSYANEWSVGSEDE